MPYISKESRIPYISIIDRTVKLICEDENLRRAENLGYFVQRIFTEFLLINDCINFNFLDQDKINSLDISAKQFTSRLLDNMDLFSQAGELNYVISSVVWGVLGDSMHAGGSARYGFRVYVKGILTRIASHINSLNDARLFMITQGVISDIIDEMYRRKTAPYEDQKIEENGDVWPIKDFSFIENIPLEIIEKEKDFL